MIKPEERVDGARFVAELIEIYSPVFFAVHIIDTIQNIVEQSPTASKYVPFGPFHDEIQRFYSSQVFQPLERVEVGMNYILEYTDGDQTEYHRCTIMEEM